MLLDEIASGARRSSSRLPINYDNGLAHGSIAYSHFRRLGATLAARCLSRSQLGLVDEAASDIITLLRIGRALKKDPTLYCVLTGVALDEWAANLIWDGVITHHWNSPNLLSFREALGGAENLTALRCAYTMEGLNWIRVTESYLRGDKPTWGVTPGLDPAPVLESEPFWIRWTSLYLWRKSLHILADGTSALQVCLQIRGGFFEIDRFDRWRIEIDRFRVPNSFVGLGFFESKQVGRPLLHALHASAALRFARLACRLEAEFLSTGRYPCKLAPGDADAIDIMGGTNLEYFVADNQQAYRLSSKGWKAMEALFEDDKTAPNWIRDWSWTFPELAKPR